ncbi:MAG: hypothetical protein HHJ09_12745 [Glaciimonas sp.]|nr:hypothetical protein [Glaciimonas sp.]
MNTSAQAPEPRPAGIRILGDVDAARCSFISMLEQLDLHRYVATADDGGSIAFSLRDEFARSWAPRGDTTQLSRDLDLDIAGSPDDLNREILLAMLAGPLAFEYPSYEEFAAAVRLRRNIVDAARRTQLAFHTSEAERPNDCWTYTEDRGFTVLPGKPLIAALKKTTQPGASGKLYSFSCYRATEYVILLGIAQELATVNPQLLERLQTQWETRAIMSGKFHDVFLYEYGTMNDPLPPGYYVPGDRLWFRNPDERSSDVSGYEGSWVFYLGGGLFSNFWKRDQPYTLTTKCIEIFHWRHGTYRDDEGALRMNEAVVDARVRDTLTNPEETERILAQMARLRDPQGVYAGGGCIDASREFPRRVCPRTANIVLPAG